MPMDRPDCFCSISLLLFVSMYPAFKATSRPCRCISPPDASIAALVFRVRSATTTVLPCLLPTWEFVRVVAVWSWLDFVEALVYPTLKTPSRKPPLRPDFLYSCVSASKWRLEAASSWMSLLAFKTVPLSEIRLLPRTLISCPAATIILPPPMLLPTASS